MNELKISIGDVLEWRNPYSTCTISGKVKCVKNGYVTVQHKGYTSTMTYKRAIQIKFPKT
jgi:hypothetical protein